MLRLLWIIPALPLLGFLRLAIFGKRSSRKASAVVGCASVGGSAVLTILVGADFIRRLPEMNSYHQVLWTWINVAGFQPRIGFYLDAVSLLMALVVTFFSFWILVYST